MLEDALAFLAFIVVGIFSIFAAVFICTAIWTYTVTRPACEDQQRMMNLPTSWSFWAGCYVTFEGQTVPMSIYEKRLIENRIGLRIRTEK